MSKSSMKDRRIIYNLCYKAVKVFVEPFKKSPPFLDERLNFTGPSRSKCFIEKMRQYNCLFSFTSVGATIDRSINDGGGPNIFQVCHRMGSLLPQDGHPPKFAELYVFHAGNEADNRVRALHKDDKTEGGFR